MGVRDFFFNSLPHIRRFQQENDVYPHWNQYITLLQMIINVLVNTVNSNIKPSENINASKH